MKVSLHCNTQIDTMYLAAAKTDRILLKLALILVTIHLTIGGILPVGDQDNHISHITKREIDFRAICVVLCRRSQGGLLCACHTRHFVGKRDIDDDNQLQSPVLSNKNILEELTELQEELKSSETVIDNNNMQKYLYSNEENVISKSEDRN